jgi:ribosomal protein S18 acetylase RimI-like enzyme
MTQHAPDITIRPATPNDACALAELTNFAGEGMPLYLWERWAEDGESAWQFGQRRVRRDEGDFSYRNAIIAEINEKAAACLLGYLIPSQPEAIDYETMPQMCVPLQELENLSSGRWYTDILSVYPQYRGQGIGTVLLAHAEQRMAEAACSGFAIIVSDANLGARRLYERHGYSESSSRQMVKKGWKNPGRNWVLLTK